MVRGGWCGLLWVKRRISSVHFASVAGVARIFISSARALPRNLSAMLYWQQPCKTPSF